MKTLLLIGLLALLVVGTAIAVWAQSDPFYGNLTGCDAGVIDQIEAASPNVNYRAACEQFLACGSAGGDINVCQFEAAGLLLESCAGDDVLCRNEALLHVAALTVYSWPPNWDGPCWTQGESFPSAMYFAAHGDYAAALDSLSGGPTISHCQPMIPYATGLIEEMRGDQDAALEAYSASVSVSGGYITPALYSRGLLLGELGRGTEASFDGERLRRYLNAAVPTVVAAMAPLIEGYPLDRSVFTTWMAYPVGSRTDSPGGTSMYDRTLAPAFSFELAAIPELDQLVLLNFFSTELLVLNLISGPPALAGYRISSIIDGPVFDKTYVGDSLAILANEDLMIAVRSGSGFEVSSDSTYFVVPPSAPDPRTGLGTRTCEGGVLSIIKPGLPVMGMGLSGLYLQSQPGDEDWTVESVDYAFLSGEPLCVGTDAWWFAAGPDGQTGWLPENRADSYEMTQIDPSSFGWMVCPGAPPSRLIERYRARVLDEPGAGELRAEPGINAALVAKLSPGEIVDVDFERACVDGQVWWSVSTEDGQSGYMTEADADTYFLEPVPFTP